MSDQPYRLIRDALGFYSQVPVLPPEEPPAESGAAKCPEEGQLVSAKPEPPLPAELPHKRRGRKKANINADFEVNV